MLSCIKYKKLWKQKGGTLLVLITVTPSYHCPGASSCLSLHVIPVKEWQPVHHLSPPFTQCQLGRLQPQCDPGWISGQQNGWWMDVKQTIMLRCSYICVQHNMKYMDIFHYTYNVLLKILCHLSHCVKVYILSGELPAVQMCCEQHCWSTKQRSSHMFIFLLQHLSSTSG